MKRGFTIVELTVVVAVLGILTALSVVSINIFLQRADDASASALAATFKSGAERYYASSNEYPTASQLFGGASTCAKPASYSATTSLLGLKSATLNKISFIPHTMSGYSSCTFDKKTVYYFSGIGRMYVSGSICNFEMSDGNNLSFVLLYWSNQNNTWYAAKGDKGSVSVGEPTCPLKAL